MTDSIQTLLARLPGVDTVLEDPGIKEQLGHLEPAFLAYCIRQVLRAFRKEMQKQPEQFENQSADAILETVKKRVGDTIQGFLDPSLRRVINGTGVILHTGLGRAPFAAAARNQVLKVMEGYANVELDLTTGKRGQRLDHVEKLLCYLSGAEAAAVVNNNAAAVLLALNTLAKGKEVIVSRGQLIEIGGSFRLPEVMEQSGAVIREVGTTNKTHLHDYERAINEQTGAILVAHSSNYRILGFTAEVPLAELAKLSRRRGIPLIYDLGGGIFFDLRKFGLPYEPVVSEQVQLGASVVTFSGDKVLGGPQSGILVGEKAILNRIRQNPMMRALRCDKLILAALEATLRLYLQPQQRQSELPVFRLLLESPEEQQRRIDRTLQLVGRDLPSDLRLLPEDGTAQIGSGALPLVELPSRVLRIESKAHSAEEIAGFFRSASMPIIGYIRNEGFYLNFRTIFEDELTPIARRIREFS